MIEKPCPGYRDPFEARMRRETVRTMAMRQNAAKNQQARERAAYMTTSLSPVPTVSSSEETTDEASASVTSDSDSSELDHVQREDGLVVSPTSSTNIVARMAALSTFSTAPEDVSIALIPNLTSLSLTNNSNPRPFSIPQALTPNWEIHAVPLILQNFVTPSSGADFSEYTNILPDAILKADTDAPLLATCRAVALAYFHVRAGCPADKKSMLNKTYAIACKEVNTALQSKSWAAGDDAMLNVWLLSLFEV
jgi:hypothetical protein